MMVLFSSEQAGVLTLTLNRPEQRNALDLELTSALVDALEAGETSPSVRAIMLTGTGKSFSAGADLKEFRTPEEKNSAAAQKRSELFRRLTTMIRGFETPVIAAVNGFALGGGCGLVIACDMAIASEEASFGYPEIRFALPPRGMIPALVERAGSKTAFDLIATGRIIGAHEALWLGIINSVESAQQLDEEARKRAELLARHDREAVSIIKRLVTETAEMSFSEGLQHVRDTELVEEIEPGLCVDAAEPLPDC
jgi:enoyl-CoA hydratase/carnithine racemase